VGLQEQRATFMAAAAAQIRDERLADVDGQRQAVLAVAFGADQDLTVAPVDVVKLDRHVIARLGIDPASDATVAAAAAFVRQTGGWVIAEGIEDTDMLGAVLDETSPSPTRVPLIAGQGYLLGRPSPAPTEIETRIDLLPPSAAPAQVGSSTGLLT